MTRPSLIDSAYLVLLWAVTTIPLLVMRPLWPIIETRYAAVAWEMWLRHDFLVPYLNGAPYSHKPPLLFWAIHAGWWLFGVNSWWPRIVPSLFTFGTIFLTLRIGRLLWPDRREMSSFVPFMLIGCLLWAFYMTFIMFDLLVAFNAVLSMYGLLYSLHRRRAAGFLLFGMGMGLGILSKGPVILVILLPVALTTPWWAPISSRRNWWKWYGGLLASLLLGAMIALAWALSAAHSGGDAYGQALLWKQTANRVVHSFAHRQPWWWYLPLLPLMLFPWSCLPSLWRAVPRLDIHDRSVRFCLAWLVLPLLIFTMISGKQVHYLLPIFPAFVLLAAQLASSVSFKRCDYMPQILLFGFLAGVWLCLPFLVGKTKLPPWVHELSPVYGGVMLILCGTLLVIPVRNLNWSIKAMTTATLLFIVTLQTGILDGASQYYDIKPLSTYLAQVQAKGYTIANADKYEGHYHFLGRLRKPLEVIRGDKVSAWLKEHPNGRVVQYFRQRPRNINLQVEFVQPFRGQFAVVVSIAPSSGK